jgi:phospholipid/cholesterol/gamma-HCH transport system substrate-binding protein
MRDFLVQCVELFQEIGGAPAQHLRRAETPFVEVLHDPEQAGVLQPIASRILMKILYAARMARPDLLKATCFLATKVTKWDDACDKLLYRLVCYINSTLDVHMSGWIGDHPDDLELVLFTDADFAGLSNGAFAAIRSEGVAQLIEFTAPGGSIQMTGGTPNSKRLVVDDAKNPPLITADRSDFQDLLENAQRLSRRADEILVHVEKLFADSEQPVAETMRNVQSFSRSLAGYPDAITKILESSATAAQSIADVSVKASRLVDQLNTSADRLDSVLTSAQTVIGSDEIKGTITEFSDAARAVRELANHLDSRTADLSERIGGATLNGLRQIEAASVESRRTLAELERTMRDFRQNPQQLLIGPKPTVPAYGAK